MHSCKIEIMMTTAVNDNYQLKQLIKEQSEKKNQALIELQTPDLYLTITVNDISLLLAKLLDQS